MVPIPFNIFGRQSAAISEAIPEETEILITHTPPLGTLDTTRRGKSAGCGALASRLKSLHACRLHVFGHIHEAAGVIVSETRPLRVSVNAAYPKDKLPFVVDLKNW